MIIGNVPSKFCWHSLSGSGINNEVLKQPSVVLGVPQPPIIHTVKFLTLFSTNRKHGDVFLNPFMTEADTYRNQSIDLRSKSVDWFLYDIGLRHERVKQLINVCSPWNHQKIYGFNQENRIELMCLDSVYIRSRIWRRYLRKFYQANICPYRIHVR